MTNSTDIAIGKVSEQANMDALVGIIDMLPSIRKGLDLMNDLNQKGILDSLMGLGYLASSTKDILNDDMINGLASLINSLLGLLTLASSRNLMGSLEEIADGISSEKFEKGIKITGTWSILRQLKDPDIQKGVAMLFNVLKVLGKS